MGTPGLWQSMQHMQGKPQGRCAWWTALFVRGWGASQSQPRWRILRSAELLTLRCSIRWSLFSVPRAAILVFLASLSFKQAITKLTASSSPCDAIWLMAFTAASIAQSLPFSESNSSLSAMSMQCLNVSFNAIFHQPPLLDRLAEFLLAPVKAKWTIQNMDKACSYSDLIHLRHTANLLRHPLHACIC